MIVYDAQRRPVELGESVGHGGEATVYRITGQATHLAKIYEPAPRPNYAGKLDWMVRYPPENPTERLEHASLAWPGGLLFDARRQLKGYWMPYISLAAPILDVFNPRRRAEVLPQFDRRYLLRTARNLAAALSALHRSGYVAGDLNESNVLVTPTALVTLIDTDSFQVSEEREGGLVVHPCPVGKPEYIPPELQGQPLAEVVRLPDHDSFALAVLIFQLLMDGSHPFRAQWLASGDPPPLEVRIANGAYPYVENPPYPVRPPSNALGINTLHPWVVEMFRRCFVDGHRDPRWRPGPDLWVRTLNEVEQAQVRCAEGHYYSSHLESCPYCAIAQARALAVVQKRGTPRATPQPEERRSPWTPRQKPAPVGAAQPAPAAAAPAPAAAAQASGAVSSWAQPAKAASQPAGPFNWTSTFNPPSIFGPGGGAAVYGYPGGSGSTRGVLRSRPVMQPGAVQNWVRVRAYKSLAVGGAQGALVGALIGGLIGLMNWTAGEALAWALLFSLGGAAGGLVRGWNPGHKMASLIDRFIGWRRFWEATGLIGGAVGGTILGLAFVWAIVPVFLGLIFGAQSGLFLGRKVYQVGDLLGWRRIWAVLSAAGFGALGYGITQVLGAVGLNIFGADLSGRLLPFAGNGSLVWAMVWILTGGIVSGLGGALAGVLADVIGRFTGLVD